MGTLNGDEMRSILTVLDTLNGVNGDLLYFADIAVENTEGTLGVISNEGTQYVFDPS